MELLSIADYIIISPCGFSIERTHDELERLNMLGMKEWQDLPAVKNGRIAIADGNKYFNRSSVASILGTAEIVAEIVIANENGDGELKGMYGHHGTRWVKLDELSTFCKREGAESVRKEVKLAQGALSEHHVRSSTETMKNDIEYHSSA